jgi:hypothetical protein
MVTSRQYVQLNFEDLDLVLLMDSNPNSLA